MRHPAMQGSAAVAEPGGDEGRPRTAWSAWHLHLNSTARTLHDRVIADVVEPALDLVPGRPWFFIRYWQGGPHLRLRVGDLDPARFAELEQYLEERLKSAGALAAGEEPVGPAQYRAEAVRMASSGEPGADAAVRELLPGGVYRSVYEPEFDRYGGPALMPAAERLFQLSSELVLAQLPGLPTARERSIAAIRATMSAGAALGGPADRTDYFAHALQVWRSWGAGFGYTEGQLDRLCSVKADAAVASRFAAESTDHGPFVHWHAALAALVGSVPPEIRTHPGQIVFSHVHMLHNRLGLTVAEEIRTYAWLAGHFPAAGPAPVPATPTAAPNPESGT